MRRRDEDIWLVLPSADLSMARETLPYWRERGYKVALMHDGDDRFDGLCDVSVSPFVRYPGYARSVNYLIRHVVPPEARLVVAGSDDILPAMGHTARELACEFLERFPDTMGIMQPSGDSSMGSEESCPSPWIGRALARRLYQGSGPYCEEYFQFYEDRELHEVGLKLGLLWRRPDIAQYHAHWRRRGLTAPPAHAEEHERRRAEARGLFEARRAAGYPGHELGEEVRLRLDMEARHHQRRISISASSPRRVICFSLWGCDPYYVQGAIENAQIAHALYPGWSVRVYCGPGVPAQVKAELCSLGAEIIERTPTRGRFEGLFWRFEPAGDPSIERFVVRDTDSRLNEREAAAVAEWVADGAPVHVMRDHSEHEVSMPAGMWGARCGAIADMTDMLALWNRFDQRDSDQEFLTRWVWPGVRDHALVHDAMARLVPEARAYDPRTRFGGAPPRRFPAHAPMSHGAFVGERIELVRSQEEAAA